VFRHIEQSVRACFTSVDTMHLRTSRFQ